MSTPITAAGSSGTPHLSSYASNLDSFDDVNLLVVEIALFSIGLKKLDNSSWTLVIDAPREVTGYGKVCARAVSRHYEATK